ncbi:hypothetical protein IC229_32775 [Spirosoma sp. BT702]|uniref:Effector-associated domain-containing protein n=1 Tax=Spirosoma profusum TaxID=2771354 RepID=A0A927AW24_9BACT|nr:effector-associated domain EAD1-containing protein [Spirosoma profusum]MBD2705431.1 hypothetical protein [Spirosoma profusum]
MSVVSTLQIHQAYFGAVNGTSHGQLVSSLTDTYLRSFLSGITDRPEALPTGFEISPYLSATTYRSYYILWRTWPDNEAKRLGMVFTHVLILPVQDLPRIPELSSVLSLLLDNPLSVAQQPTSLGPLSLSAIDHQKKEPVSAVPESWLTIINQLIDWHPGLLPIFVSGEAGQFQKLLEDLWRGLPGTLRGLLGFGIRFTPPNKPSSALPMLVYIPVELEDKWRSKQITKLDTNLVKAPEAPIEQLILNGQLGRDFLEFINNLDLSLENFRALNLCQRAYVQFKSLQPSELDAGKSLALLRSLRQLQPDPNKAVEIKRSTIKLLAEALPVVGVKEAMGLRNLPLTAFPPEGQLLGVALEQIVTDIIKAPKPNEDLQKNLLGYLVDTNAEIIEPWWRQTALKAFEQSVVQDSIHTAKVIWLGVTQTETIRDYVLSTVPNTGDWEQILSKTIPRSLLIIEADSVTSFCVRRDWWDLFAETVAVAFKPVEALRRQVEAEKQLNISISPRVGKLVKRLSDSELVDIAVELTHNQLLELAGEVCGRDPKQLLPMDVHMQSWRTIWSVSLTYTNSITAGLSNPKEAISTFLTELAYGRARDSQPLELIAASTYANILDLPERTIIWNRLPPKLLPKFVATTLDALVEEILAGKWTGTIEPILMEKARSIEFIGKFLGQKWNEPAAVLSVNDVLHNLSDNYLRDYINNLSAINGIIAARLGKLVYLNNWDSSARALLSKAKSNTDFRPALYECTSMFNLLTKFINHQLFGHQATSIEAWYALEELLADLYEEGPDGEYKIWKKAGGDVTKFSNAQSRRAQWTEAIRLLRYGGGGKKISAESLIKAALDDYKDNSNLKALASLKHLFQS